MRLTHGLAATTALLFLLAGAPDRAPAATSKISQKCIAGVSKAASKIANLQAKENYSCLRDASDYALGTADGETCMRADLRGRIAKARSKVVATAAKFCAVAPPFGFVGADEASEAVIDQSIALAADLFGAELAEGALSSAASSDGPRCQASVLRAADGALATKLSVFAKCLELGLKTGAIDSAGNIGGCIGIAGGDVTPASAKAREKLRAEIFDDCAAASATDTFPGNCALAADSSGLATCLASTVECRLCRMLAGIHGTEDDCDLFDDGAPNASCDGGTGTTTTTLPFDSVCGNAADEAVEAEYDLLVESTNCTYGCLFDADLPACVATCVTGTTGLSYECALCYGRSSQCGIAACTAECAVDQTAPACTACLDVNCIPAFDECASVPLAVSTTLPVSTTTTTSTTLDTTTTTTLPAPTTTTTLPLEGFCTNEADQAIRETVDIDAATRTCTFSCLSAGDVAACIGTCVADATGLSGECAQCYGDSAYCGIANCASPCAANPNGEACLACVATNCGEAQNACIGTPPTTTTTLDTTTTSTTTTTLDTTTTTLPAVTGACTNPADDTVHESYDLLDEAVTCTVGCLSDPNRVACVASCLTANTGVSPDCAGCYADSSECGLQNCAGQCAIDQNAPPCQACLEANCIEAFDDCSGFGDPPLPASCSNAVLDGTETDVDCGGACEACVIGDGCGTGADCVSGECVDAVCSAPTTALAFGSCANGYIDPGTDVDALDLGSFGSGADDGYVVTLASPADVYLQLINQAGATTVVQAALLATPGDATSVASGLATGEVVAGQNGTAGPTSLAAGTYYLYVDSGADGTFGAYDVCVLPAPTIELGSCVAGSVGNGDGDDLQLVGTGGDKALRFAPSSGTNVIVKLRNLSGTSTMAAALYNGATQVTSSDTGTTPLFTERTAGPAAVAGGVSYTLAVDTAEIDTFGAFEVCVVEAGCGDGIRIGGESCDDGNKVGGDGCSASCTLEAGNLVIDSCRTDSIPLFGNDCDDWTLPVLASEGAYLELSNPAGDTLLATGAIRSGGSNLVSTGNVPVGQTGSTSVVNLNGGSSYTVRICDVTGAGTGTYTACVRRARKVELGSCYAGNVTDGDGNVIDLAGPISGGDEDVLFQPPRQATVRLELAHEGGGGLLASGVYDGQPGNLVPGSAVGASPSPIPAGSSGQSGLFEVNLGVVYRVYTDIASPGTAGTNYRICLTEVAGDACLNDDDELVRSSYNLDSEAEAAGLDCTGNSSCISSTLQADTGLSAACADCFGGTGSCAASNCALQCLGDSGSSGCRSCVASNCATEFEVCSGWVYGD